MSTLLARWEARQQRAERRRWVASTVLIVLGGAALIAALHWRAARAPPAAAPIAAMVIELMAPQAPPQPSAQPVGERQTEAPKPKPAPPKPQPKIETPTPSEIALPDSDIVRPNSEPDTQAAPQTQAPPSYDAAAAAVAAAPSQGAPSTNNAAERVSFEQLLLAHLERNKRYPSAAQQRRQQGVPYLRFVMDRPGTVLSARLERGSGHALLDEAALALLYRAQPLPAMPATMPGDTLEVVVPIEFFMPRR